ncbi:MAG: flavin reductase family protein [Conexivisphaerales archaeon]|nr:flavin reductase family protein [Conexivisphaerales archaeon]
MSGASFEPYRGKFYRLLHPRPTVVVVTKCEDRLNAAPFSWNTPVSEDPPVIAVAMGRSTFTRECLRSNPEATVNVIPPGLAGAAYELGNSSGRTDDKISRLGLELVPGSAVSVPGLAGAVAIYEVKEEASVEVGIMDLVLMRVLAVRARTGIAGEDGLLLDRANVALHGAGEQFFRVHPEPLPIR